VKVTSVNNAMQGNPSRYLYNPLTYNSWSQMPSSIDKNQKNYDLLQHSAASNTDEAALERVQYSASNVDDLKRSRDGGRTHAQEVRADISRTVPGEPVLHSAPETAFSCNGRYEGR
jgi:hypothetical protein